MGRMYTVSFAAEAETAALDFFELTPADDKPIAVHGLFIHQTTETGDAAEEMLEWSVVRGHTTSGSGGTAGTIEPLNAIDSAAGFTAEYLNTTIASLGTTDTLHRGTFNVRVGLEMWLPPECRWYCSQAQTSLVVRLISTPADSISFVGSIYVEELI